MQGEGRQGKADGISLTGEGNALTARLNGDLLNGIAHLQREAHIVKAREVGQEADIAAVDGRRVQNV